MRIYQFLTNDEQEQILINLLTSPMFERADFEKALKDGCFLTPKVVYLAYFRGKQWLETCNVSRQYNPEVPNLCNELYGNEALNDFFTICLKNNCIMAYYIYPDETIEYIENHESENLEVISEFKTWIDINPSKRRH